MQQKIAAKDYGELREFTKQWDLDFRKAVLGKARKAMPKGPDRDRAVLVANAVTFDLIGINKAIRKVGAEDPAGRGVWKSSRSRISWAARPRRASGGGRGTPAPPPSSENGRVELPAQAEAQRWFNVLVDDIRDFLTLRPSD